MFRGCRARPLQSRCARAWRNPSSFAGRPGLVDAWNFSCRRSFSSSSASGVRGAASTIANLAAASAAASVAALWAAKAAAPPQAKDGPEWCRKHSFPAESQPDTAASEGKVLHMLAEHGLAREELRAGASTSWSGVEVCVEMLGSGGGECPGAAQVNAEITRWRRLGAFRASAPIAVEPETRSTYAVDVGSAAPSYIGRPPEEPRLSADALQAVLAALREDGAAVVSEAATKASVSRLRRKLRVIGGGGPFACPQEVSTADILAAAPGAAAPLQPTAGRRHFLIRGTQLSESDVSPLMAALMPVVYRYFAEQRPDALPGLLLHNGAEASAPQKSPKLYLSECQLLVSDPGAVAQMWHRDNQKPGLTVLIPLTDVDDEVGPTQLLPGTHHFVNGAVREACAGMSRSPGAAVAAAPLRAGDALVYDARLLHRGLGNSSYGRCRVVVVMRIDYVDTPPPGATVTQTAVARAAGTALQAIGSLRAALPVPT